MPAGRSVAHRLEAVRAGEPVLPRAAEGRLDPQRRHTTVPCGAARLVPRNLPAEGMHLRWQRAALVPGGALRVPWHTAGALPAVQLQLADRPASRRRVVSEARRTA